MYHTPTLNGATILLRSEMSSYLKSVVELIYKKNLKSLISPQVQIISYLLLIKCT